MNLAPIALNGRFSGTAQPTGTQTVAFHLYDAMLRDPQRKRPIVVFADPRYPGVAEWNAVPNATLVATPFQDWSRGKAQLWEQFAFPLLARRHGAAIGHHPLTTCPFWHAGVKTAVTVHDLNFYLHPEWYSRKFRAAFALVAVPGIKRADLVTTVSGYVREHVIEHFGIAPKKVHRIYNGGKPAATDPGAPWDGKPYILCVGSLQPHKNLPRLIAAYVKIKAEFPELELRVVGRPQPRFSEQPELTELLKTPGIRLLGYLSEADLAAAYRHAEVFCYPSLEEGFGLPLIESMQEGTPVVTSRASCLPEIAGGTCELVDPLSIDDIARGLRRVLTLPPEEEARIIEAGRKRAAEFTWERVGREYLDLFEEMVGLRRVLLVSEPGKDGVFDLVCTQVAHMRKHHPEITVDLAYSTRREGAGLQALVDRIREGGGTAVDLRVGNAPEFADFAAARRILKLVRERRPQVIHAHSSKAGGLCRVLARLVPGFPPVVYTPSAYFGMGGAKRGKDRIYNLIEAFLGRRGLTINCSSDEWEFGTRNLRLPPRRLVIVNNSVDVDRFRPASPEEKRAWRDQFGIPQDAVAIVAVGRQSYQKNYAPLYAALDPLLAEEGAKAFFVHAGHGSAELGETLSPAARARFCAVAFTPEVEKLLAAGDAFVLASRYEGMALTGLAALAAGPKVFFTRVPGNKCHDRIGFQDVVWIEPSEDIPLFVERLREAFRAWLADPRPPGPDQVARARRSFCDKIQTEKVCDVLLHAAEHPKKAWGMARPDAGADC